MDYMAVTLAYYEHWLGKEGCISGGESIQFIYSDERNTCQAGYSQRFDMWLWLDTGRLVVSYGDRAADRMLLLKEAIGDTRDTLRVAEALTEVYGCHVLHEIAHVFEELPPMTNIETKTLTSAGYADFEAFFLACNTDIDGGIGWLYDYFCEMAEGGYCAGVYADGILVSCTDGPTMPYMEERIQHTGINTLPAYRGRGYAKTACIAAAKNILEQGKVPEWSCGHENVASLRLAEKVGFVKLGEVLKVTL